MGTRHRLATVLTTSALTLGAVALSAAPATAAPADKEQVLSSFTQTSAGSYDSWLSAWNDQSAWADYEFDWSTDYCSSSPDNPLGFPFKMSCARHDFGYRNYKEADTFDANKSRLDSAFYEDMKRVCDDYSGSEESTCDATAWTYYQAVKAFG